MCDFIHLNRPRSKRSSADTKANSTEAHSSKGEGGRIRTVDPLRYIYTADVLRMLWEQMINFDPEIDEKNQTSPFNSKQFYWAIGQKHPSKKERKQMLSKSNDSLRDSAASTLFSKKLPKESSEIAEAG